MKLVSFERQGRNVLARLLGRVFHVQKMSAESLRAEWAQGRINKVLLVRPHQGLGDLLLASPIFRALKTSRPDLQLHFLADHYNPIAVRGNPHLDRIWTWDKKKAYQPGYLGSFFGSLRAERFDLAIVVSSHIPSFTGFLLARFSGARIVAAFATESHYGGANWSRQLADLEIPAPSPTAPEWVKFMDLVRPLGVDGSYEPEFFVSPADQAWAEQEWRRYSFPSGRPVVGLYLGGNPDRPERLWPAAAWAELARKILDRKDVSLIAIVPPEGMVSGSGHAEPGIYEEFCRVLGERTPVFRHRELTKVAAFLSRLQMFVCPDGGLMHIAIASRVPTLGLCFETDPDRWVPPVPWAVGLRAPDARRSGLAPDAVFKVLREKLFPMAAAR